MDNFKKPFFSIIIPIYKVEKYLRECVESVLRQTYKNIEIILVDDGSPDLCPKICDDFRKQDERVNVIHKENGGLSDARNIGIENAVGEYILFLDSDDYYTDPFFLEELYKILKNTDIEMVFHRRMKYFENGEVFLKYNRMYNDLLFEDASASSIYYTLSKNDMLDASACLKVLRKKFIKDNNLYFKKDIFSEDVEWFFRASAIVKKIIVTDKEGYCYRIRDDSISHTVGKKNVNDMISIIKHSIDIVDNIENNKMKNALFNYIAYQYFITVGLIYAYNVDDRKNQLREMKKYRWLVKYCISKKNKLAAFVVKYFWGIAPIILGWKVKR